MKKKHKKDFSRKKQNCEKKNAQKTLLFFKNTRYEDCPMNSIIYREQHGNLYVFIN